MHDAIFAGYPALDESDLFVYAASAGVDREQFRACLQGEATAHVSMDLAWAASLRLNRTPAFLIGYLQSGEEVEVMAELFGALPLEQFEKALNAVVGQR